MTGVVVCPSVSVAPAQNARSDNRDQCTRHNEMKEKRKETVSNLVVTDVNNIITLTDRERVRTRTSYFSSLSFCEIFVRRSSTHNEWRERVVKLS